MYLKMDEHPGGFIMIFLKQIHWMQVFKIVLDCTAFETSGTILKTCVQCIWVKKIINIYVHYIHVHTCTYKAQSHTVVAL